MKVALQQLLTDTERYIIVIKRSSTNWETGEPQGPDLTLFETDPIDLVSALDPRLLRSRHVTVVLADRNNGVAKIDITLRSWQLIHDSPSIRDKLTIFNSDLISGGRAPLIRPSVAVLIFVAPLLSYLLLFVIWSYSSATIRKAIDNLQPGSPDYIATLNRLVPPWLDHYLHTALALWPACIVVSLVIGSIRLMAGGLRVWPEALTFKSATQGLYRIRLSTFTADNAGKIMVGVLIALISSLLTLLFTR